MIDNHVLDGKGISTSSTLLVGVRNQDPEAWQRFMSLYRSLILHWCQRARLQPADAEDVTQEVFEAVAKAIHKFRHDQAEHTLRGWLRIITRNKILDHARRAAHQARVVGGSDAQRALHAVAESPPILEEETDSEKQILIRQAFEMVCARFKDHTRQAFWRVVVDKQKPEDVACELGIEVHSVYLARSRILQRLQEEFGHLVSPNLGSDSVSKPALEDAASPGEAQ